jgi:thioesterase domain-containing protein
LEHLKKQYGFSKKIAKEAARYMFEARIEEINSKNWGRAKIKLIKYYSILKRELKLAFEPKIVASLQAKLWEDMAKSVDAEVAGEAEEIAKQLYAELYRISLFQAAKAAKHMVLAKLERNLAEGGNGEEHWEKAEEHLAHFYGALNERIA